MRDENNIEELFQSSFEDFEMTPPDSVKKGVDQVINGSRYRRIWWVSSLVAVIGGGAIIAFLYFGTKAPINQQQLAVKTAVDPTEASQDKSNSLGLSKSDQSTPTDKNSTPEVNNSNLQVTNASRSTSKEPILNSEKNNSIKQSNPIGKPSKEKKTVGSMNATAVNSAKKTTHKKKPTTGTRTKKTKSSSSVFPSTDLRTNSTKYSQSTGISGGESDSIFEGDLSNNETKKQLINPSDKPDSVKNDVVDNTSSTADVLAVNPADSSSNELNVDHKTPIKKPTYWMASLYAGPQFGLNSQGNDPLRSIAEKTGSRFSLELNRTLFRGYGVTTGFGYGTNSESYRLTQLTIVDSIYLGQDSIPIYDLQNPDSIIGYNYVNVYDSDTTKTESTQLSQVRTIGIPLFVTRQFMFSEKWGLLVNAGAVFSFYKVTLDDTSGMTQPTTNDFSINVAARLQLTYKWGNWMLSAGVNGGWDMRPALMYQGLDRKRYFLTPQIGLHFSF